MFHHSNFSAMNESLHTVGESLYVVILYQQHTSLIYVSI